MLITCNGCQKKIKVPDAAAGKRVKCPTCATVLRVPAANKPDEPETPPDETAGTEVSVKPTNLPAVRTKMLQKKTMVGRAPEDEEVEEPKKTSLKSKKAKTQAGDDDEEPKPKKKGARDEDDEPKSKKKSRASDEDDDDAPKSSKRKKDRDENDDDDDRGSSKRKKKYDEDDDDVGALSIRKRRRDRDEAAGPGISGMAIASMVLGIVALVIYLIGCGCAFFGAAAMCPFAGYLGWGLSPVVGLVGAILGFCGNKPGSGGFAWAGIITSLIAILLSVGTVLMTILGVAMCIAAAPPPHQNQPPIRFR